MGGGAPLKMSVVGGLRQMSVPGAAVMVKVFAGGMVGKVGACSGGSGNGGAGEGLGQRGCELGELGRCGTQEAQHNGSR